MSLRLQEHQRIDERSIALHRAIAEKLCVQPELIEIAGDHLDRWSLNGGNSQPYWDAWREILQLPLSEVLPLLEERGERMTATRQATPFAGVLTPVERWAIYERSSQRSQSKEVSNAKPQPDRAATGEQAISAPPQVEIQWTEHELASFAKLDAPEPGRPTEALIRAMQSPRSTAS
jgi:hypothetical protein